MIGVIADDFTGATDIAGFMVQNGLSVLQVNSEHLADLVPPDDINALVVSHKSRSCPPDQAIAMSLRSLEWLQQQGAQKIFFKYCSTFDSTPAGNIGPVADALLEKMQSPFTIICPSLPVNGRMVYQGHLFVGTQLLHESPMKEHPLNPMADAHLGRLIEQQSRYKAGVLSWHVLRQGIAAVQAEMQRLCEAGFRYIITDALDDEDLSIIAQASLRRLDLFTGGSGLGGALAQVMVAGSAAPAGLLPRSGPAVVLSGSCSTMTLEQIEHYRRSAPYWRVDVPQYAAEGPVYLAQILAWFQEQPGDALAPLIYASAGPEEVAELRRSLGQQRAGQLVEEFFAELTAELAAVGVSTYIVAGGETSGAVSQALQVKAFRIGPQISPGVPWVQTPDGTYSLALKSGNFGGPDFFQQAQQTA